MVDVCAKCGGVWFDKGELKLVVNQLIVENKVKAANTTVPFTKRMIEKTDQNEGYRTCPKCGLTMKKLNYAYDSNVFVDKCQGCEGIWTDKGEVKQIAQFLKKDPQVQEIGVSLVKRNQAARDMDDLADVSNSKNTIWAWYLFGPTFLLPLGDDEKVKSFPYITVSIISACIAIFAGQLIWITDPDTFVNNYGFFPWQFAHIGAITHMFLHGGVIHLLGNMWFLWIFGKNIEYRFGKKGFPIFYLAAGFFAALLQSVFSINSSDPMVGASGAISGVMGAYLILYPKAKLKIFWLGQILRLPAYLCLVVWFSFQLYYAFLFKNINFVDIGFVGVAWFAHIGGFVFGMLIAVIKRTTPQNSTVIEAENVSYD